MKNLFSTMINATVAVSLIAIPVYTQAQAQTQEEIAQVQEQAHCLAQNIYFEARGSTFADRVAVADVVLNRVNDNRYPNTICDVVYQGMKDESGNMIRHKCQFSWYCDGRSDVAQDEDLWQESMLIAWNMIRHDRYRGISEGATHYHATYVNPQWARDLQQVGRIGAHVFYRWE